MLFEVCIGLGEAPGEFLTRPPAEVVFLMNAASHANQRKSAAMRSLDGGM